MSAHTTLWIAHIQSFISLGFMAVFAALSLGLAWLLAWFRLRSLGRGANTGWLAAYRFWVRVFALSLALALAGGVALLIQLAGLWPGLLTRISAVGSPLLAWAVVSAFLFKSCCLGPMLFAEQRLSPAVHAVAVLFVAAGITLTLTCLLLLGSWMQTPTGVGLLDGQITVRDWRQVLRNPVMLWTAAAYLSASLLCSACVVLAVTAWQTAARPADGGERLAFRSALWMAAIGVLTLAALTPGTARMTAVHQPAKAAAVAAYWHSGAPVDVTLFALPDQTQTRNRAVLAWRNAGERWLGVDAQGHPRGLDQFSGMHPPVAPVFLSARGAWLTGLLTALTLAYLGLRRRTTPDALSRRERAWIVWMGWSGACLLLCGVATLVFGAYPFAVYGVITLDEVVADAPRWQMIAIAACTTTVYALLLIAFVAMIRHVARYGVVPVTRHRGRT